MKVGVLFNCQHRMLAEVLRLARPEIEVKGYDIGQMRQDHGLRAQVIEELVGCDQVLTLPMGPEDGPIASQALKETTRLLTVLPGFFFAGFHPDTIFIGTKEGYLGGFTHHYHSRIAVAGYLSGRSPRETADLYNALVMARGGYFDAYAQERLLVCQMFASFGVDLNPIFERWVGHGRFMHSLHHPQARFYTEVALKLLEVAGLVADGAAVDPGLVSDDLGLHPTHPVLPSLARRLGVPPETIFKPSHPHEEHAVQLERFVELEFDSFAQATRPELEAAPGVAAMRSVLG